MRAPLRRLHGRLRPIAACLALAWAAFQGARVDAQSGVTRATLPNGLRVVIVRDPLAPVATVEDNYLAGGDDTSADFPGTAHAQEHMAFRGCSGVSADQTAAIFAELGGYGNADTQQTVTQYFTTVPAEDVDLALRMDAACMSGIDNAEAEWAEERGAIEQEVSRDLSDPIYNTITRLNQDVFAGTPYAHDALGTRPSFEQTTAATLKAFHDRWYAPNNAVLVVTGDVDPARTLATIREVYGGIRRHPVPAHPAIDLQPVKAETFTLPSNLPYALALVAYRLPGSDSRDFAATRVLTDVLTSQRADLYSLVAAGRALFAEFDLAETYPKASLGFAAAAVPSGSDPSALAATLRQIVAGYAANGVPPDLVAAARRSEAASAAFNRNSIPGLADAWSQAVAVEGRRSPDDDVAAIQRVTVADVNRVARTFLADAGAITATLAPSSSAAPTSSQGFGGTEQTTSAPTTAVTLPGWAAARLAEVHVPPAAPAWTDTHLPNGIRLLVRTVTASPTVTLVGHIRTEPGLQVPKGQEGIAGVLDDLFSYGTTTLDRLAFQKALDDIAASESAGSDFSLRVLSSQFGRGVELLADNELRPALPDEALATVKQETAGYLAGRLQSPGYRADRALRTGLLPEGDPALRDATPDTVSAITLAGVKQFYASTFRPDLTTIVVIGDITPDQARTAIAGAFGGWTGAGPAPVLTLPHVPANAASSHDVPDPTQLQASVVLAEEVGITRYDDAYYALQLGNHVLGGGFYATRLYHDLRQVAGYVYTVDNSLSAGRSRSVYEVTYGCDPPNVDKARALIDRDIEAMRTTPVTPAELQQAKALLLRQLPLQESSEEAVADGAVARADLGLPLDEPHRAAERYAALSAADIQAAFRQWIDPARFVEVVRGPK
jgi:zinc protease